MQFKIQAVLAKEYRALVFVSVRLCGFDARLKTLVDVLAEQRTPLPPFPFLGLMLVLLLLRIGS